MWWPPTPTGSGSSQGTPALYFRSTRPHGNTKNVPGTQPRPAACREYNRSEAAAVTVAVGNHSWPLTWPAQGAAGGGRTRPIPPADANVPVRAVNVCQAASATCSIIHNTQPAVSRARKTCRPSNCAWYMRHAFDFGNGYKCVFALARVYSAS